jgi:hypothetical protein
MTKVVTSWHEKKCHLLSRAALSDLVRVIVADRNARSAFSMAVGVVRRGVEIAEIAPLPGRLLVSPPLSAAATWVA